MSGERYPENEMMFPPDHAEPIPEHWQRFFDLREDLLLNYGHNTARAYWADLQDWFEWAVERDKDVLELDEKEQKQYCALLRRRNYSENTIRRRLTALRLLRRRTSAEQSVSF
jgi:site-specific recombinase XerD